MIFKEISLQNINLYILYYQSSVRMGHIFKHKVTVRIPKIHQKSTTGWTVVIFNIALKVEISILL